MKDEIVVRVYDIVGSPICVSADDGQKVYDKIEPLLRDGHKVALSFDKVGTMISLFLNAAIGQLYGVFPEERIRELLSVQDVSKEDLVLLKRVVDNAKSYFANRKEFDQAWNEEAGDEE
jgi:hypothetical protein